MKEKVFIDQNGAELIIQHRKSAIFFIRKPNKKNIRRFKNIFTGKLETAYDTKEVNVTYYFDNKTFKELFSYLNEIALESWKSITPREADSLGSDYYEYYDRDYDSNGYLEISSNKISIEGVNHFADDEPYLRLYKFNKRKFESFIYDFEKLLNK